jgi:hypothetical protein
LVSLFVNIKLTLESTLLYFSNSYLAILNFEYELGAITIVKALWRH